MSKIVRYHGDIQDPIILHLGSDSALIDGRSGLVVLETEDHIEIDIAAPHPRRELNAADFLSEKEINGLGWPEIADAVLYRIDPN